MERKLMEIMIRNRKALTLNQECNMLLTAFGPQKDKSVGLMVFIKEMLEEEHLKNRMESPIFRYSLNSLMDKISKHTINESRFGNLVYFMEFVLLDSEDPKKDIESEIFRTILKDFSDLIFALQFDFYNGNMYEVDNMRFISNTGYTDIEVDHELELINFIGAECGFIPGPGCSGRIDFANLKSLLNIKREIKGPDISLNLSMYTTFFIKDRKDSDKFLEFLSNEIGCNLEKEEINNEYVHYTSFIDKERGWTLDFKYINKDLTIMTFRSKNISISSDNNETPEEIDRGYINLGRDLKRMNRELIDDLEDILYRYREFIKK